MALFTLTDIRFSSNRNNVSSNKILEDKYRINTLRYPIDLGEVDKGHYMVLHINEQKRTQFPGVTTEDDTTAVQNRLGLNRFNGGSTDLIGVAGKGLSDLTTITKAAASSSIGEKITSSKEFVDATNEFSQYITENSNTFIKTGVRTTKRTTDTIALYMPDTLAFSQSQNYAGLELGGGTAALLGAGYSGLSDILSSNKSVSQKVGEGLKNATPFVLNSIANLAGNAGRAIFAGFTGTTVNPMMEVVYSSPEFRSFRFDFMFYPRSRVEAREVQNIIDRIRFHQAPEVLGNNSAGGYGGYFLVPPSEFDIKFYYNGTENPNIPKISTCVLTTIDVDYAPNGFATYEVAEDYNIPTTGGTGMPIGIRMGLVFKETQLITKFDLQRGKIDNSPLEKINANEPAGGGV